MNGFLYGSTGNNKYATFFYAQLEDGAAACVTSTRGTTRRILTRRTATGIEITELSAGGTVLGLFPDMTYRDADVDLRPGDLLVAFTDGVTEALNAAGEEFGEERLKALLRGAAGSAAHEVSATLAATMREWIAGTEQYDDLTFVVVAVD